MAVQIFDGTLWQLGITRRAFAPLRKTLIVDVAIVGAGITGLLTAILLRRQGFEVAVLEATQVGAGVTGASSAHLTEVPDIGYVRLTQVLGEKGAIDFVRAYSAGFALVERLSRQDIHCDFGWAPAYRYSERAEDVEQLEQEADAAMRLGIDAAFTVDLPAWCSASGGVRFARQGMFNPVRFLEGVTEAYVAEGGQLFEGSRVTEYHEQEGAAVRLVTQDGECVLADHVVLATHTPISFNAVQALVAPYQSYVTTFGCRNFHDAAMFWDSETPYHYIRPALTDQGAVLIVGGEDHKAGDGSDPEVHYRRLEAWARQRFTLGASVARWSDTVYEPADGVPYFGRSALATSVSIATGFSGVGLVGGAAASIAIAGEIAGRPKPWASVFSPTRLRPIASARSVLLENLDVAARWLEGRLAVPPALCPKDLPIGEGRLVTFEGKKAAVYRDEQGAYHALSPTCTHLGCTVNWNAYDKTWDCPCHGGRFSMNGEVISGPPTKPLGLHEPPAR